MVMTIKFVNGLPFIDCVCTKSLLVKPVISVNTSFKEQLLNDLIPRIEDMKEKEWLHLRWLIDNNAPMDFINLSREYYNYFIQRIKEYHKYAECL